MIKCIIIGFFSGIISGMGIGGGALLIPAVVFFCKMSQQQGQFINLLYFIPTALSALFMHNRKGNIEKSIIKPLVLYGIGGALIGSFIASSIDEYILRKIFGVFITIMGVIEIFKKEER
ncbi:permease [Tyzzerella sp. An114]|uniref:sulfite exporter TauE/SafE family protein n=1 Tax=Tyzzerella sp. An114 TaxID=1965545 RepID=UPI000B571752|nr:sulfite exporter TauE/SafE family protein [Tyzzerella sp. An114]OUQ58359.1 permease [Tyzzerella sp. An114]